MAVRGRCAWGSDCEMVFRQRPARRFAIVGNRKVKSRLRDSNPAPVLYESTALPNELRRQFVRAGDDVLAFDPSIFFVFVSPAARALQKLYSTGELGRRGDRGHDRCAAPYQQYRARASQAVHIRPPLLGRQRFLLTFDELPVPVNGQGRSFPDLLLTRWPFDGELVHLVGLAEAENDSAVT